MSKQEINLNKRINHIKNQFNIMKGNQEMNKEHRMYEIW